MDDELLTVNEIAATLKINPQTVRNWIDAGSLPAVRVGRRVRVKRSDFDAVVDQGYNGRRASAPESDSSAAVDFWNGDLVTAPDLGDAPDGADRAVPPREDR